MTTIFAAAALICAILSAVKPDRPPLWVAVILLCVGLLVAGVPALLA